MEPTLPRWAPKFSQLRASSIGPFIAERQFKLPERWHAPSLVLVSLILRLTLRVFLSVSTEENVQSVSKIAALGSTS